jgi:RNA-directed DNA polymerase
MALFSNSKKELWEWQQAIIKRLELLRLVIHDGTQVIPVEHGIPWLGFIVCPQYRRVKARNVINFERRLKDRWLDYCQGKISFAELDSTVQGWINHVRYADTWGLRKHVLSKPMTSTRAAFRSKLGPLK